MPLDPPTEDRLPTTIHISNPLLEKSTPGLSFNPFSNDFFGIFLRNCGKTGKRFVDKILLSTNG